MSDPTDDVIVASMSEVTGVSDTSRIVIDITQLAAMASPSRTTMIMVTYDSINQAFVTNWAIKQSVSVQQSTAWGRPQTAVLLTSDNLIENELILQFSPAVSAPVNWRACGVVADATIETTNAMSIGYRYGPITLPDASTDLNNVADMYFAFFASGVQMPVMSDPERILPRATVTDYSTGLQQNIVAYNWNQLGAIATGAGPWFYTLIKVRWIATGYHPPSTISDDFWAPPAPCDAADVIIINNNLLAPYWDIPEMNVAGEPDTLLLNYIAPDGARWMVNEIEGWWTLPPPALPDLPRPGYLNGSFPVDGRYEPRIITITGTFWPAPGSSVAVSRLRLLRSLDAVRNGALLVVKEPEWAKQSWVWLSDQPAVNTVDMAGRTEFEVTVKAVDPVKYHAGTEGLRKELLPWAGAMDGRTYDPDDLDKGQRFLPAEYRAYGDTEEVAPSVLVNSGTANVSPRIFLYGPMLNPVVVRLSQDQTDPLPEQTMVIQGAIHEGEVLIIDCYWRTVVMRLASEVNIDEGYGADVNGVNKRWMLKLSSPWIYLAPGMNHMYYKASEASLPDVLPPIEDISGNPKMEALVSDFSPAMQTPWRTGGFAGMGGPLEDKHYSLREMPDTPSWLSIFSDPTATSYSMIDSYASVEFTPPSDWKHTGTVSGLMVTSEHAENALATQNGLMIAFRWDGASYNLIMRQMVDGVDSEVDIPYDPVAMKWISVGVFGHDVSWSTSPDSFAWTERRSAPIEIDPTILGTMRPYMFIDNPVDQDWILGDESGQVTIDNFNTGSSPKPDHGPGTTAAWVAFRSGWMGS